MPALDDDIFTQSGERGWIGNWHKHVNDESFIPLDEVLETRLIDETRVFFSTSVPQGITRRWTMKLRGYLKPRPYDCTFEFGLIVAGRAKVRTSSLFIASDDLLVFEQLFVDGELVIDNWTRQRRGGYFFGCGSEEERGTFQAKAGTKHEIFVLFCNVHGPADGDEEEGVMDKYLISLWIRIFADGKPLPLATQGFVLGVQKFETQTDYFKKLLI